MDRKTMMHFYKARNVPFGVTGLDKKRKDDSEKLRNDRKNRRTQMFNSRRSIKMEDEATAVSDTVPKENNQPVQEDKLRDRKLALEKYRHDKEVIKQTLNQKKRPPFVVGIPHHGNSPVLKEINNKMIRNGPKQIGPLTKPFVNNQRLTRATSKLIPGKAGREQDFVHKSPVRMFPFNDLRKSVFTFQHKGAGMKKLTSPHTPTVLKRSAQKVVKSSVNLKKELKTSKPVGKVLKKVLQSKKKSSTSSSDSSQSLAAPLPITEGLDDISEHATQEVETVAQSNCEPLSATVPIHPAGLPHRNLTFILPDKSDAEINEETATIEESQSPRTSSRKSQGELEKEESDADPEITFQRERVDKESRRLLSLAEEWEAVSQEEDIPRDAVDEIDSVIGQTRLLTRDKFNQFCGLVDQYQNKEGTQHITVNDLNGFWEMVYLQVETLMKKFSNLEKLKNNNWEELKPETPPKKKRRAPLKKKPKKDDRKYVDPPNQPDPLSSSFGEQSEATNVTTRSRRSHKRVVVKEELEKNSLECLVLGDSLEEAVAYTPRRSLRLFGKTATPLVKYCATCQSPDCGSSNCKKGIEKRNTPRSRRSTKNITVSNEQELETLPIESSCLGNVGQENESNKTSKRFTLRPSKLILGDSTNKTHQPKTSESPAPKKTRNLFGPREGDVENSEENIGSCFKRRSSRLLSAKKVTFNSNAGDKCRLKLPATPYGKKGCNLESFSDSFSE